MVSVDVSDNHYGATNIDMVKEFYANWEPGFDLEKESTTTWVRDARHRHEYLKRESLTLEDKVMLRFINCRILPTSNDTEYNVTAVTASKRDGSAALTTEQGNTSVEQFIRILFEDLKLQAERGRQVWRSCNREFHWTRSLNNSWVLRSQIYHQMRTLTLSMRMGIATPFLAPQHAGLKQPP
ncbi:hypothetical protein RND71_026548 [Anisodus tanguticus]|uniref:Uncharacterized protein n=1 Tax=Anisodus tanguticus TaxID=243964 RepID=A0AAE1VAL8_9SOLA|nr:hypothetical protein RND71_026548 [Anisodus tanguticus]